MYHNITSTIRWTARRSSWSSRPTMFHPPTGAVTTSIPHQATSSLSMFATVGSGSSSSNGDNNNGKTFSSEQRRPFWATRPAVEDDTTSKTITATVVHTIDHKVNATGAAAGLAMDDVFGKESKKAKASKKKKTVDVMDDDEEEIDDEDEEEKASAKSDPNTVNNSFIAGKIAADQKITKAISKQIVDQVFEILSESIAQKKKISIPKFGIFVTGIQKPKTMTNIKTKEKYAVPAKYRLAFKPSSVLRKKVAEMEVHPEDLATLEPPK